MTGIGLIGLNVPPTIADDPVRLALDAERLGFDFVSANDHLHGPAPRHETWTLLAWIAAVTSRLLVASRVLAVPYRNPAVLAKMAETLDRLSGGRLVLGLGAGAAEAEFAAFGIPTAPLGSRLTGLEEAIAIARGLWADSPFSFEGAHHSTRAAVVEPKPGRPIPIWIGTHGPRGLELVGRAGDGWIASIELAPPDVVPGMVERIARAAEAADRELGRIQRVYNVTVSLDPHQVADADHPYLLAGTAGAVAEQLAEFASLGFNALNLIVAGRDLPGQVEQLGEEVLPAIRR
jgi:alkanesulfonate monooxygenase SsuD/methylene tetrahydromethanopterin reductase-like flavin-dependent oxidoreductase (luciferase family)